MLYATFSTPVNAPIDKIWTTLLDKMENPHRYIPYVVEDYKIWERHHDGILREIKTAEMHMKERTIIDRKTGSVTFEIVDHPLFSGTIINQVSPPPDNNPGSLPIVTYTFNLQPRSSQSEQHKDAQWFINAAKPEMIKGAVLHLKSIIEGETLKDKFAKKDRFPGEMSEIVRRMFKAGESMNVENFVKFYAHDAHYQFGNFPVVYGPEGIKGASQGFLEKVEKVMHHIKNMWEVGDTVICEMEVTYIRHDGKVFSLPCCDTIVFNGDQVQALRIYMDITPVFGD